MIVGFVLGVMSILATAVGGISFELIMAWTDSQFMYDMQMFIGLVMMVFFLAVQGLILFGFPMFYAQDKKCHMTGLQLLVYALLWQVLLMAFVLVFTAALT